jgi:hypothetical protein
MKYNKARDVQCSYEAESAKNTPPEQPFFETKSVSGRAVASRYSNTILAGSSGFAGFSTTRLFLVAVVHVVGVPSVTGGFKPIVDEAWINTLFQDANRIWSQACIELVPFSTGSLVTNFFDGSVGLLSQSGLCLDPKDLDKVEPHDITVSGKVIVNVYLLKNTSNGEACGSHVRGHVFLPTADLTPANMGRVFAHEIGHVLMNPLGVDDSLEPNHLMFHASLHPEIPPGSRDGLFLSDCLGAQTRAREDLFSFARPGGLGSEEEPIKCQMIPRLGNNLVVVATSLAGS